MPRYLCALLALSLMLPAAARAQGTEKWQEFISESEFEALVLAVAPRVDLFAEIWRQDPQAELYGGTSRDLAWFVRGQLATCETRECVERVKERLPRGLVTAEEIIAGESDVDLIASRIPSVSLRGGHLTKIDIIHPDYVRPETALALQESLQGGLPVEKIRITATEVRPPMAEALAGGLQEIYRGVPTLHYDPRIVDTPFYQQRGNHPILLVLRYLRQVACAYYHRYGRGAVNVRLLATVIDPPSWEAVETILRELRRVPQKLEPFLANPKFHQRFERVLKKLFRSYLNPNAAQTLFHRAELPTLLATYGNLAPQYQMVLFAKARDAEKIATARKLVRQFKVKIGLLKDLTPALKTGIAGQQLPDDGAALLHGTPSEAVYRLICYQGILPSLDGSAGAGTYAVDSRAESFAARWRVPPGQRAHVVRLVFKPEATVLDLRSRWQMWPDLANALGVPMDIGAVADALGADVILFPLNEVPTREAYVVKNGAAILRAEPHSHDLRSFASMQRKFNALRSNPAALAREFSQEPMAALALDALTLDFLPLEKFQAAQALFDDDLDKVLPSAVALVRSTPRPRQEVRVWAAATLRRTAAEIGENKGQNGDVLRHLRCLLSFTHLLEDRHLVDELAVTPLTQHRFLVELLQQPPTAVDEYAELLAFALKKGKLTARSLERLGPFAFAVFLATPDREKYRPQLTLLEKALPAMVRAQAALVATQIANRAVPDESLGEFVAAIDAQLPMSRGQIDFIVSQLLGTVRYASSALLKVANVLLPHLSGRSEAFRAALWEGLLARCEHREVRCDHYGLGRFAGMYAPPLARREDGAPELRLRGYLAGMLFHSHRLPVETYPATLLVAAKNLLASADPKATDAVQRPFVALSAEFSQRAPEYPEVLALIESPNLLIDRISAHYVVRPEDEEHGFWATHLDKDILFIRAAPAAIRAQGAAMIRRLIAESFERGTRLGQNKNFVDVARLQVFQEPDFMAVDLRDAAAHPFWCPRFVARIVLNRSSSYPAPFNWDHVLDILVGWSRVPLPAARFENWDHYLTTLPALISIVPPPPKGWGRRLAKEVAKMPEQHPLVKILPVMRQWPPPAASSAECGTAMAN